MQVDPSWPVDWSHPLNKELRWWGCTVPNPGWFGGTSVRNLCRKGRAAHDGLLEPLVTPGTVRPGGYGKSIKALGAGFSTGDCLVIPSGLGIGTTTTARNSGYTLSFWFNPITLPNASYNAIVDGLDPVNGRTISLFITNTGNLSYTHTGGGSGNNLVDVNAGWQHITYVQPITAFSGRMYRNGKVLFTESTSRNGFNAAMYFGENISGGGYSVTSMYDDINIANPNRDTRTP
jgi:hypothetical protein